MDYISTQQAAVKWCISERRVQQLCEQGRIDGVLRFSCVWAIPKDAPKPQDPRKTRATTKTDTAISNPPPKQLRHNYDTTP